MLALWFDLLPAEKREAAARRLVDDIRSRGTHLSTGFVGTSVLMPTLSADRPNAAGLQAVVERNVPLLGLFDPARRHDDLGAMGRLDAGEGLSRLPHELVRPLFVRRGGAMDVPDRGRHRHGRAGLPAAVDPPAARRGTHLGEGRATIRSTAAIATEWRTEDGKLTLSIAIPANTTATVCLPAADPAAVTEGGRPVATAEDVRILPGEDGQSRFEIGAGEYRFVAPWKPSRAGGVDHH